MRRCIYAFWHESILFFTVFRGRFTVLVSRHADGELMAQVCRHLRFGVARGSTGRGGAAALLHLVQRCQSTHLLVEKLLLTPTEQLKALGDAEASVSYAEALTRLFGLSEQDRAANVEPFTRKSRTPR